MLFGNGARAEKRTGKYGLFSNLIWHYKNLLKWEPKLFWIGILLLIPWTLTSILGNVLPAVMVAGLEQKWDLMYYMVLLLLLIIAKWVFNIMQGMMLSYYLGRCDYGKEIIYYYFS